MVYDSRIFKVEGRNGNVSWKIGKQIGAERVLEYL